MRGKKFNGHNVSFTKWENRNKVLLNRRYTLSKKKDWVGAISMVESIWDMVRVETLLIIMSSLLS